MRNLAWTIVVAAALAGCGKKSTAITGDDAKQLLIDRNWIDRMPETERDKLHVYRFVPNMGGGVFQDRTIYKGTFELFKFSANAQEIEFDLLETNDHVTSPYTIEAVDGPGTFDLKLTISGDPRGPHVYFGWRAETDRDGMLLEQRLHAH